MAEKERKILGDFG